MGRFTLQVLPSNHGYYLGTETDELVPYSRESGYWELNKEGFEAAEKALADLLDGKGLPLDKRYNHPANLGLVEKIMKGLAEKKERKKQQDDTPDDIKEGGEKLYYFNIVEGIIESNISKNGPVTVSSAPVHCSTCGEPDSYCGDCKEQGHCVECCFRYRRPPIFSPEGKTTPWTVQIRESTDLSWLCAPIRIFNGEVDQLVVEMHFNEEEAKKRAAEWERELNE